MRRRYDKPDDRRKARREILHAANRASKGWGRILGPRQIQQAVFRCRQRGLVAPSVYERAGFRP